MENNKLNEEKMELNEKIVILTDLLNNPENIGKYVDEEGNLNFNLQEEQQYEGNEDIPNQNNENIDDENNEDIQYHNNKNENYDNSEDIKNENINFEYNEN